MPAPSSAKPQPQPPGGLRGVPRQWQASAAVQSFAKPGEMGEGLATRARLPRMSGQRTSQPRPPAQSVCARRSMASAAFTSGEAVLRVNGEAVFRPRKPCGRPERKRTLHNGGCHTPKGKSDLR